MASYTNFTKYIPIKEEEYHAFKEQQRKEIKHAEEEISRPSALQPLVAAQNEKTKTLFETTNNPELQEQRLAHLTSVINRLKRQVEEQGSQQNVVSFAPSMPLATSEKLGKREQALFNALGNNIWNANDELVIDGAVVPNSDKNELLNYAASNWTRKYLQKAPEGGAQLRKMMRDKNIPEKLWSAKLRSQTMLDESPQSTSTAMGSALTTPSNKKKNTDTPFSDKKLQAGLEMLNSEKEFNNFMKTSKKKKY
jgi:hypothetical protein